MTGRGGCWLLALVWTVYGAQKSGAPPARGEYEVIFDAGSTGTRMYVFNGGHEAVVMHLEKRKPGLATFYGKGPETIATPFIEMLDTIKEEPHLVLTPPVVPVYIWSLNDFSKKK